MNESLDALREADVPTLRRLITAMVFHHEFPYPYEDVMDALLARVRAEVAAEGRTAMAEHFPPVQDGEWIRPPLDTPFLMECCDCGLVHALSFDHDETGRIIFAASRYEAPAVAKRPLRRGRGQKVTR